MNPYTETKGPIQRINRNPAIVPNSPGLVDLGGSQLHRLPGFIFNSFSIRSHDRYLFS